MVFLSILTFGCCRNITNNNIYIFVVEISDSVRWNKNNFRYCTYYWKSLKQDRYSWINGMKKYILKFIVKCKKEKIETRLISGGFRRYRVRSLFKHVIGGNYACNYNDRELVTIYFITYSYMCLRFDIMEK